MKLKQQILRVMLLPIALGCLLAMSGCWDNAEINGRAFVLGFGADKGTADGTYDFTFQLAIPVSGDSNSSGSIEYTNYTVTERSAASAIRTLEKNMGRQINFEQLNIIIIGEELSHEKFIQMTELFFRRASVRRQSSIAVCGGSAKDFFAASATGNAIASDASIALQSYDDKGGADSVTMNLHSLFKVLSNTDEFYLLKITAVAPDEGYSANAPAPSGDTGDRGEQQLLSIAGAVAYGRAGEYRGELDAHELELLRLISGNQISGIVTAEDTQDGETVYYQIKQSRCTAKCRIDSGVPHFTIDLHVICIAADVGDLYGSGESSATIAFAEECITRSLTRDMNALAERSRTELGASVLKLQDIMRQNMPDWYEENAVRWEELYAKSNITVNVDCTVSGGGITK